MGDYFKPRLSNLSDLYSSSIFDNENESDNEKNNREILIVELQKQLEEQKKLNK